jgi:serine/threonine-protein kinase
VSEALAEADRSGATIAGKYRLLGLIGRGGMGAVYEAENTWTRRRVAVKVLRPEYAREKEALRRFMQEAQAATQIAHPHIIDVFDLGIDLADGSLYMVQELLSGEDLRARLRARGRLSPREALEALVPVLGALACAHERGVVHRDIKPENIYLARGADGQERPKLIDFGVSKVLEPAQASGQTREGTALGTPRYMAPEQLRGESNVDVRADVWSVGVVIYELISGVNPFEAATAFGSANRVLNERPEALVDVPASLSAIVQRALSPDRAARPASARALLDELCTLPDANGLRERHAAALAARPPELDRAVAPVVFELMSQIGPATAPTMPAPEQQAGTPRRVAPALWLVVLLFAMVAGWLILRRVRPALPVTPVSAPPPAAPAEPASPSAGPPAITPTRHEPSPARPSAHPAKGKVAPRTPAPEEGPNQAPIVE